MWAAATDDPLAGPGASAAGPPLWVLVNPGSGAQDKAQARETLQRVFAQAGREHHFIEIDGPSELEAATDHAAREAKARDGVLVAVGGDGTINTVAQAAWRHGCVLGVLPQGTFNLFGRDHGISQELEPAAQGLLRGRPEPVQVGEVNGRLFLVNASLGLYPQLLQDRETFKQQFGRHRWVAVLSGLVTLFEWRRQMTLEFELDGKRTVVTTPTLFVGNNKLQLERIGLDPDVAAQVGEGCLAAVVARPIGTWQMVWLLVRGAFGRLGDASQVRSFAFRSLHVRVLRARKLKVAADGEVGVLAPPLHFSVASRPLMLLMPQAQDRVPVA